MLTKAVVIRSKYSGEQRYHVQMFAQRGDREDVCGVLEVTAAEFITVQNMLTAYGIVVDAQKIQIDTAQSADASRS